MAGLVVDIVIVSMKRTRFGLFLSEKGVGGELKIKN